MRESFCKETIVFYKENWLLIHEYCLVQSRAIDKLRMDGVNETRIKQMERDLKEWLDNLSKDYTTIGYKTGDTPY